MQIDLKGRVALVTGGSRGIGRATALLFAESGAKVAIGYRNDVASASTAVEAMRAAGTEAFAIRADVSTAEGCAALHAEAVQRVGPIDVLVNNAGHHENDVFLALDDASFSRLFDAHVLSVVRLSRLVAPSMMARRWGRILNLSSVAATKPTVGQANYSAAKAAVEAITRGLAIEFHKRGVNVNAVAPGLIATDMVRGTDEPFVLSHQLVKRLGRPEEIASWLLMLASRHGDYVTGRIFELDGGFMLI
jgi:3-oxoacyl-[acyl-carrier protein] reductase